MIQNEIFSSLPPVPLFLFSFTFARLHFMKNKKSRKLYNIILTFLWATHNIEGTQTEPEPTTQFNSSLRFDFVLTNSTCILKMVRAKNYPASLRPHFCAIDWIFVLCVICPR